MENILNIQDHIDAPILKSVVGLNLLGFKTYMSCCGYDYDDPKVPKTHLKKAYIYLDTKQVYQSDRLSSSLNRLCMDSNWRIGISNNFLDFYANTWDKGHPWESPQSVHYYEVFLLAIHHLNKAIEYQRSLFLKFQFALKMGTNTI